MNATQAKVHKISQTSPSGFYVEKIYVPNYEAGTVTIKKYISDPWGILSTGWAKPIEMSIEDARKDYRKETTQFRFAKI